ncbi:M16 family metallopeptidase [Tenacibaculum agarivorans]|uniref:M16 family metallopeptidase n=1 Tax=Tenacibaculum agarivorans TaxID=1908389 RepID=UPI00094B8419|nr:pitrilysin family protein [Tenacibaculum agarivorans]
MKIKIASLIAILTMSFAVNAQRDLNNQPKPGPAPKIKLGKPEKFKLKNGLQVILVENHKLPRASASLTIDNKPVFEGDKAGVSSIMGSLLGNGTNTMSKDEFNEKVDYLGASLNFSSSGAFAASLEKYFPEILTLMADGIKNPIFTQEEFDKEIERNLEGLKNQEKDVKTIASRVEDYLTYGSKHPYGEYVTPESMQNIKLEDVKKNYTTYYRPNNAYLVIVGDINPKKTKKLVTKLFSGWTKGNIPNYTMPKPVNPSTAEINFVNMPNAVQSEVAVVNNIDLTLGDKDYYAALIANNILGGGGTARLFMNLREDKGYTYGSYSRVRQSKHAGKFKASASVRNMVTDSSVVEILKEINKIRYQKVSEEELKNSKAEYVGNFVMDVQKPRTVARFALNIARYNLPADFYEKYLENINAVTLDDVQNAAKKYFQGDKARIFVTGKGSDVLKNLEKTSYAIKYFDKKGNPTSKPKMNLPIPAGVTANTVVDDYFKAIGGKDKVAQIKSVKMVSGAKVQGLDITLTSKSAAPNKTSQVVTGMGQTLSKQVFDGTKGYAEQQGRRKDLAGKELEEAKSNKAPFDDEAYRAGKLVRIEPVNGNNAYVIKHNDNEIFYDMKTGLKIKSVRTVKSPQGEMKVPTLFSDYKEVNGVKFPHKIDSKMGPMDLNFVVKEIKVNDGVSDADFQ